MFEKIHILKSILFLHLYFALIYRHCHVYV